MFDVKIFWFKDKIKILDVDVNWWLIVIPYKNRAEADSRKLQIWFKCGFSGRLIIDTYKTMKFCPKNQTTVKYWDNS